MNQQLPPHNIDAEEGVIGSLLIGADLNSLVIEPSDFYHERLRECYKACVTLSERGVSINQITLGQQLSENKTLENIGGVAYLSHLIAITPTHLDCDYYAEIVKRTALYRSMILVGDNIAKIGYEQDSDVSKSLNQADEMLLALRKRGGSTPIISPHDRYEMAEKHYEQLNKIDNGVAIPTMLRDLDTEIGGGFYAGEMIILGARPGMGKTSMLMTITNNIAKNKNVLFCSAEMPVESITDRDIAGIIGESVHVVRKGGYSEEIFDKIIVDGLPVLQLRNVYFYHDIPLTTSSIMQSGVSLKLRNKLDLIVVDYLGLLDDSYGNSQYERIGYVSRKLKQIAMKLNVPILVAHQLSRALESRNDRRPQLSDLRDSGRIEEDADLVLMLYRDSYYDEQADNITEIGIEKQRQGDSNKVVRVVYDNKKQKYQDMYKG